MKGDEWSIPLPVFRDNQEAENATGHDGKRGEPGWTSDKALGW